MAFYNARLDVTPEGAGLPTHRLGKDLLIDGIASKSYSCCLFVHGFIYCALALRAHVDVDAIENFASPLSAGLHH